MRLVNCGGLPANSLESLIFGHEKGAFPGAFDSQIGLLQHCDGGTLILDEIDRMDRALQDRLALQLARDAGLDRWLEGRLSDDQFARNLSLIWAGLPLDGSNRSAYQGVSGNRAMLGYRDVIARLHVLRKEG